LGRDQRLNKKQQIKKDLDEIIETAFIQIIYALSPVLGGRSEVLETPVLEALEYLVYEKKKKQREKLERFQYLFFGANSNVDPKARKKFYDEIRPKDGSGGGKVLGNPTKKMEWDHKALDEFRAK
jgi:hypothetical protein